MDTMLLPVLDQLRLCLCSSLDEADAGGCFCGLYPGPTVAADFCSCDSTGGGCGMAWVRLMRIFPSTVFPTQDSTLNNCGGRLAAQVEVGIYRCQPTVENNGQMDPVKLVAAAAQLTEDAMLMRKAIVCCAEQFKHRDFLLGQWQPAGLGDCGGGTWSLFVEVRRDS